MDFDSMTDGSIPSRAVLLNCARQSHKSNGRDIKNLDTNKCEARGAVGNGYTGNEANLCENKVKNRWKGRKWKAALEKAISTVHITERRIIMHLA